MSEYKNYNRQLLDAKINTKAIYDDLLQQYADDNTSVSDPDWEQKIDAINLARLNWLTAKSRLEGLTKKYEGVPVQHVPLPNYNK
mgnify:CR=1 FL=1